MGPLTPAPLLLRGSLATAAPPSLSATVPLTTQRQGTPPHCAGHCQPVA